MTARVVPLQSEEAGDMRMEGLDLRPLLWQPIDDDLTRVRPTRPDR
jgi:hypothetical protein